MKELELLKILTNVKNEYILEAQELRSGQRKQQLHLVRRKRLILIAAVLSMLLLAGCAAVLVGLQKVSFGRREFSDPLWMEGETYEKDVLSLHGFVDSPEYLANQEWLEYENSYDPDGSLLQQADANGYEPPPDYFSYLCYTEEMEGKIDAICEKYGLELAGPIYFGDAHQTLEAVAVPSIANDAVVTPGNGRYYRSGSFLVDGDLQHRFGDRQDPDELMFSYSCDKKGVFFTSFLTTDDLGTFDAWEYTAWDGTPLLLAQNKERGLILTETGDCFISVVLYFSLGEVIEVNNPGLRKDMEEIADAFAYSIQPEEPGVQWLQYPNMVVSQMEAYQTYASYFANWLPGSVGSEAYSPDYQQKFVDLDEDGADEMLIWNTRTGVVHEVVTKVNGAPYCVYGGGTYGADDHTVDVYLCEGNTLEKDLGDLQGKQLSEYYRLEEGQLLLAETVMEGTDGRFYWSESGGASSVMWTEITEGEYQALRAKYLRIGVPKAPSSEEVQEIRESEEAILWRVLQNQEPFFAMSTAATGTLEEYCGNESERMGFDVSITRYALVDMDGDGVREAVVDFRFGENSQVMCMVLKYESHNAMVSGTEFYTREMSQIKEDGSFAYSGGGDNDGWGKLRWENYRWVTKTVEDSSGKADVSWYSYSISEG